MSNQAPASGVLLLRLLQCGTAGQYPCLCALIELIVAEMSCIAGVGGNVPALVRKAQSGRRILALDGCQLHCVKGCLAQHGILRICT
jgi:hypothetical protein